MIPLRDVNPTRVTPYVVYGILAISIVAYIYNGPIHPRIPNPLSGLELVPVELTMGRVVIPSPVPAWVTIFTSMFIHANSMHIFVNMLYLWIFGNNIEDVLGHFKFLVFYLAAGVGAALAQVFVDPTSRIPMVGASGAIAGTLGAYLYLFPKAKVITIILPVFVTVLPAFLVLGYWIALQLINSILLHSGMLPSGGIAYAAHTGGFVMGLLLILLLGGRRLLRGRRPAQYARRVR